MGLKPENGPIPGSPELASLVPTRPLRNGDRIPAIGLGTFGSDKYTSEEVSTAVAGGLRAGYRLVDCAAVYGNEADIGQQLHAAFAEVAPRDEFFVMSKIWNDSHDPEAAVRSVEKSLRDLRVDYLDAMYVHWPFPNHHAPHAETGARDPNAKPYNHDHYMRLWSTLEGLVDAGIIKNLGTSNMTIPKLDLLLADARIAPSLNEMELHPCFQQPELFRYCVDQDIQPVGFSPLGSPSRPERDRTTEDIIDTEQPAVQRIARARDIHPALVCLKWAVARGQIPIPFSVKPEQYTANLLAATSDPLTAEELDEMRSAERNNRLIKGQVFLWPGATSWHELWDVDGTISGQHRPRLSGTSDKTNH